MTRSNSDRCPFQPSRRQTLAAGLAALLPIHSATRARAADATSAVVPPASADEWPEFRGPTGQGLSTAKNVPVKWGADENVAWRAKLPGQGWSSPVLSGGKVFLTCAAKTGDNVTLAAACLDAKSGKLLWGTDLFNPDPAAVKVMHRKNTLASPTVVVRGDRVYAHFGHMGTAALDTAGKVLWRQTELSYPPTHGNGSSPMLTDRAVVFSADAQRDPFLAALDQQTGRVLWKTSRQGGAAKSKFSFATPLLIDVGGRPQIVSPASGYVAAYAPDTGAEIWRVEYGMGYSVVPRPVYAHGLLFLSSGFDKATLYAIRPQGAAGDVTNTHVAWRQAKGAPLTPSALVLGDEVYTVSDNGIATCADAKTGTVHWTHRLDGNYSASPVAAEGRVYFQNETGLGYVIKAGKTYEQLAENDVKERTLASYAVGEGALFIRTESQLLRVGV
jgi:outer membrane protein assembly factor BamB